MDFTITARRAIAPLVLLVAFAAPAGAQATSALGIPCAAQSDGVQFCQGSTSAGGHPVPMPDGVVIDANVTLPTGAPPAGGFPLVIVGHGYGGHKQGLDTSESPWLPSAHALALRGYAVLNATDRGFGESCGSSASRLANPAGCAQGWIHLMDARYEVHDAQYMAGLLVDENLASSTKIGAIGDSYGGGESLMLGTLKDRVMDLAGNLQPWRSPGGSPMSIAAATPTIPWSDLISSLVPNGRGLDYTVTQPTDNYTPAGVEKQSFVAGLYALGAATGYYAPPGVDPGADLTSWFATFNAGEPYDGNPAIAPIVDSFRRYRGAFYVLDGVAGGGPDTEPPAPMLLSSGFTDDLFPVDETLRYYNLEKQLFPDAPVSLSYLDYGHQRGQNKTADTSMLRAQVNAWLDHYVLGTGSDPGQYVTALTQTCPSSAPSSGPYSAASWAALHPGALQYTSTATQTITSVGGDPSISGAIDPITGSGACASVSAADQAGVATYRLPAAADSGFTLIGAPTVIAQLAATGPFPEIAARLWDVAPDGTQTLVDRGDFRPPVDTSQLQFFQLHPGAWHFAAGHVPKLELLGRDAPYLRASNGQFTIAIAALRLLLPTVETSGNGITVPPALPAPPGSVPAYGATLSGLSSLLPAGTAAATPVVPASPALAPKAKHPKRRCVHARHKTKKHAKKAASGKHKHKTAKKCKAAKHKKKKQSNKHKH
ncbi:MAG: hypothetical protein NVSMB51_16390 [Solirubrobacteraceae bacterium]